MRERGHHLFGLVVVGVVLATLGALPLVVTSCGRGGADGGGGAHLPAQIGPFEKLGTDLDTPLDEPFVLAKITEDYSGAAILADDGLTDRGDELMLYAERRDASGRAEIVHTEPDPELVELSPEPIIVLSPSEAWEGNRVGAPTLLRRPSGRVLMFFEGGPSGTNGIGRASSADDGHTFEKNPQGPVLTQPGARMPSVIAAIDDPDGALMMYFTADGAAGPELFMARSIDEGLTWDKTPVVKVLSAGVRGTTDGGGPPFDEAGVEDATAWGPRSPTGAPYVGLYYVGVNAVGVRAIGYAASFDGKTFTRLETGPIVAGNPPDEVGPAVRRESDRSILLFTEQAAGRLRIAAALQPTL